MVERDQLAAELENVRRHLGGRVKELSARVETLTEGIVQAEQKALAMEHRNNALLYALCLMQGEVRKYQIQERKFKFSKEEGVWLAT